MTEHMDLNNGFTKKIKYNDENDLNEESSRNNLSIDSNENENSHKREKNDESNDEELNLFSSFSLPQAKEDDSEENKEIIERIESLYEKQQALFAEITTQFQAILSKFLHSYTSVIHERYEHMTELLNETRKVEKSNKDLSIKLGRLEKTTAMLYQTVGGIVRSPSGEDQKEFE